MDQGITLTRNAYKFQIFSVAWLFGENSASADVFSSPEMVQARGCAYPSIHRVIDIAIEYVWSGVLNEVRRTARLRPDELATRLTFRERSDEWLWS